MQKFHRFELNRNGPEGIVSRFSTAPLTANGTASLKNVTLRPDISIFAWAQLYLHIRLYSAFSLDHWMILDSFFQEVQLEKRWRIS
jgi:hypothetical protein